MTHFKMFVKVKGSDDSTAWDEEYRRDEDDAQAIAQGIIDNWNRTLRPHEKARELVRVELISDKADPIAHQWEKQNTITIKDSLGLYDVYKCQRCKITGKRFGLSQDIKLDSAYRAKYHNNCGEVLKRRKADHDDSQSD